MTGRKLPARKHISNIRYDYSVEILRVVMWLMESLLLTWVNFNRDMHKQSHPSYGVGLNNFSIPKLQRHNRWSFGADKSFHSTLYCACDYLSMLGLKLMSIKEPQVSWLMDYIHKNAVTTQTKIIVLVVSNNKQEFLIYLFTTKTVAYNFELARRDICYKILFHQLQNYRRVRFVVVCCGLPPVDCTHRLRGYFDGTTADEYPVSDLDEHGHIHSMCS